MTQQEKAQLDYAVKRYKAAEKYLMSMAVEVVPQEIIDEWQSLVNSEPTIAAMETVEVEWPGEDDILAKAEQITKLITPLKSVDDVKAGALAMALWLKQRLTHK